MKTITVPSPIKLRDLLTRQETGQEYPFFTWLQEIVLMDVRFSVNWKTNRSATKLADAFFKASPGQEISVEDSDYDLLKEAAEEPQRLVPNAQPMRGYAQPALFQQVGPFIEAVLNAK